MHLHIIIENSLTFTNRPKPKIAITVYYGCAYVTVITVLINFSVILQTITNFRMLSIGCQGVPHLNAVTILHCTFGKI